MVRETDPIVALSTPQGAGAIAVIRTSGPGVIEMVDALFHGRNLTKAEPHTVHYGKLQTEDGRAIDECLATVFRSPRSYTCEDSVELSCHGSSYIVEEVIKLLLAKGLRLAEPGEFTQRAFLNGQLDLAQAEAVADLIATKTKEQHHLAITQMRGQVSKTIAALRGQLVEFAGLIELENDFGEEDVEFADRTRLKDLANKINLVIQNLQNSFRYGQAIKEGVAVAIVGSPNVGKSTLLNALLGDEKAIVSEIAGTTRDVIEDSIQIDGILFRFIDTAGMRDAQDEIERIGIDRTMEQLERARMVLHVQEISEEFELLAQQFHQLPKKEGQQYIIVLNKSDEFHGCHRYDVEEAVSTLTDRTPTIALSALSTDGIDKLKKHLVDLVKSLKIDASAPTISNLRHFQALSIAQVHLEKVLQGLENQIPSDLIALDLRYALHHLGEISGEITTDDLLGEIFSKFCIGK